MVPSLETLERGSCDDSSYLLVSLSNSGGSSLSCDLPSLTDLKRVDSQVCSDFYLLGWFSSVQFSCSVISDSLWPHELQHTSPPCPSPTLGVYPNSCPLCRWCHPTISSSVTPFSSCPQSFPASGSFQMNQLFASGGQSIGVSASTSVLPMNTQDWSLGWTGWISLQSKGLSRVVRIERWLLASYMLDQKPEVLLEFIFVFIVK